MSKYDPNGRGHRSLTILSEGPRPMTELRAMVSETKTANARSKVFFLLGAMLDDGLIFNCEGEAGITQAGRDALAELDAGEVFVVTVPTVRVFDYQPRKAA